MVHWSRRGAGSAEVKQRLLLFTPSSWYRLCGTVSNQRPKAHKEIVFLYQLLWTVWTPSLVSSKIIAAVQDLGLWGLGHSEFQQHQGSHPSLKEATLWNFLPLKIKGGKYFWCYSLENFQNGGVLLFSPRGWSSITAATLQFARRGDSIYAAWSPGWNPIILGGWVKTWGGRDTERPNSKEEGSEW